MCHLTCYKHLSNAVSINTFNGPTSSYYEVYGFQMGKQITFCSTRDSNFVSICASDPEINEPHLYIHNFILCAINITKLLRICLPQRYFSSKLLFNKSIFLDHTNPTFIVFSPRSYAIVFCMTGDLAKASAVFHWEPNVWPKHKPERSYTTIEL